MKFLERLRGEALDGGEWRFDLAEELNGAFGGTNGGALAAVCVHVARAVARTRIVAGADVRFIRGFRPGRARVVPRVLNEGRTLTTLAVDIFTAEDKLATHATVSLVAPEALVDVDQAGSRDAPSNLTPYREAKPWRQPKAGAGIPLIETFSPRLMGRGDDGVATGTRIIWDDDLAAEAACIAADISVGPPVAAALKGRPLAMPNPDISLRFTGARAATDHLVSVCRLESITGGLATTSMEVWSATTLVAVGASTTTCLGS